MKPTEKISEDLFLELRSRFSPIRLGNTKSETTSNPEKAVFFSFIYREGERMLDPITISLIDKRSLKMFYTNDMIEKIVDQKGWYDFLKRMRQFASQNLLTFDAKDVQKSEFDPRDFDFIRLSDSSYDTDDLEMKESIMYGTVRKSYQTIGENAKLIINHTQSIDPEVRGARSRKVESIFIERADGEKYRVPFKHVNGARSLAHHVNAGGTPYDAIGESIINNVKEMQDLSRFSRLTRKVAMESEDANTLREQAVICLRAIREHIYKLQRPAYYSQFVENFGVDVKEPLTEIDADEVKSTMTRRVWSEEIEDLVPTVTAILNSSQLAEERKLLRKVSEARGGAEGIISDPNFKLTLRKNDSQDGALGHMSFNNSTGIMSWILGDIASRAVGKNMDPVANFAAEMSDAISNEEDVMATKVDRADKKLAVQLTQKYLEDYKKLKTDPSYADEVRIDMTRKTEEVDVQMKEENDFTAFIDSVQESWESEDLVDPDQPEKEEQPIYAAILYNTASPMFRDRFRGVPMSTISSAVGVVAKHVGDAPDREASRTEIDKWTSWTAQMVEKYQTKNESTTVIDANPGSDVNNADNKPRKTNPEAVKAMAGDDPKKAADIKRLSDKMARGQRLTPQEEEMASEIAKQTMTSESEEQVDEAYETDLVDAVKNKFPEEFERFARGGDLSDQLESALMDIYSDEMPIDTQMGNDDTPDEWLFQRLSSMGYFDHVHENDVMMQFEDIKKLAGLS